MCNVRVMRLSQAIRIFDALLLLAAPLLTGCGSDAIAWTDPMTLPAGDGDSRLRVDDRGRTQLLADTSVSVVPAHDGSVCPGSVRAARIADGSLVAVWWSVRADSSSLLLGALSPDGGTSWRPAIRIDTADVSVVGCSRPPAAIATSAGFVHVVYSMRASEGAGVFYAHSMNNGQQFEVPLTIVYGDRLTRTAVAADKGTIAVAYEDPSGATPQIGLAISRDWGHIFDERTRGSTGLGAAMNPDVAVAAREVAVTWLVSPTGEAADSDARASRIVRVGRLR
jgi:hypothetical protein